MDAQPVVTCRVCAHDVAKYRCPRCNVPYCSLNCYKSHGTSCTEGFYRDNVMAELASADKPDSKTMLEILSRVQQSELDGVGLPGGGSDDESDADADADADAEAGTADGEEDVDPEYIARLEALSKLETLSLEDLTPEELGRFRRDVAAGKLSKLVETWVPWWMSKVVEADEAPVVPSELKASPSSPMKEAPPQLQFNLLNIVYAYAYTCRLFNGEWSDDPLEASSTLLALCAVLSEDARFPNVDAAVSASLEAATTPSIAVHKSFAVQVVKDVHLIVGASFHTLRVLLDAIKLLRVALDTLRGASVAAVKPHVHKLKLCIKKLEFYVSFVDRTHPWALSALSTAVELAFDALQPSTITLSH